MKYVLLTGLLMSFTVNAATVTGSCQLTRAGVTETKNFTAQAGEKLVLGIYGGENNAAPSAYNVWTIEVVNNIGTEHAAIWGAFFFGVVRPVGTFVFRNPPILCPVSPQHERERCEAENAANEPKLEASLDEFQLADDHSMLGSDHFELGKPVQFTRDIQGIVQVSCEALIE